MSKKQVVYSNAHFIEKLGKAFENKTVENVSIPQRDCPDVPEFISQLKLAQEATRRHSIKFG